MKAPPRVLTLSEQPLDSLETDQTAPSQSHQSQGVGFTMALFFHPFLFLTLYNKFGVVYLLTVTLILLVFQPYT